MSRADNHAMIFPALLLVVLANEDGPKCQARPAKGVFWILSRCQCGHLEVFALAFGSVSPNFL